MGRRDLLTAFVVLTVLVVLALHLSGGRDHEAVGFATAVDGDTLEVAGMRVRLAGLDAPELHQTCGRAADGGPPRVWPCGEVARAALVRAMRGHVVHCTGRRRDAYHRLLATCRVGEEDVGAGLVRAGLALSAAARYRAAEHEALAARRGIWAGPFERPADWRAAHPR